MERVTMKRALSKFNRRIKIKRLRRGTVRGVVRKLNRIRPNHKKSKTSTHNT